MLTADYSTVREEILGMDPIEREGVSWREASLIAWHGELLQWSRWSGKPKQRGIARFFFPLSSSEGRLLFRFISVRSMRCLFALADILWLSPHTVLYSEHDGAMVQFQACFFYHFTWLHIYTQHTSYVLFVISYLGCNECLVTISRCYLDEERVSCVDVMMLDVDVHWYGSRTAVSLILLLYFWPFWEYSWACVLIHVLDSWSRNRRLSLIINY